MNSGFPRKEFPVDIERFNKLQAKLNREFGRRKTLRDYLGAFGTWLVGD